MSPTFKVPLDTSTVATYPRPLSNEDSMMEPRLSILDETDSGLDIDALRIVAEGVNKLKTPETSTIVITHYQRLLDYIKPDIVHVLYKGRIVKTAGPELALELEDKGYDWIKKEVGE